MGKLKRYILFSTSLIILINCIYLLNYKVSALSVPGSENASFLVDGSPAIDAATIGGSFVGIGKFLTGLGGFVLVAATTYMGIQYFISGPEKQGQLKGQLMGLVISGAVIFGAYGIWKMAVGIFEGI